MSQKNDNYLSSLRAVLSAPAVKQLVFLLGIAGGVTLGIFLYMSIQSPTYRPIDYQITQQNMASIVDTLDKAGIQYKINEQDGVLYVAASDLQQARIKLSAAGIAKDDSISFSYLNDQNSIGNSQFMENARYIRALESDLAKTISALEGISAARVHIAIPANNVFADENQRPTASIVVNMATGLSADKDKIRAIVQIVASSVPGLDPKDVAITDQYGHYLSGLLDQDSLYNAEQLNYQNSLQGYYEKRIESMISPLLGDNKVNVRVYADLDFTQQEEAQEQYDPDKKVIRSEQNMSEQNGGGGASGAPGALSNTPPEADAEKNASAPAGAGDAKNQSIKNYEISKSVTYKKSARPKLNALSVAVVLDNEMVMDPDTHKLVAKPVSQDKINKITALVKATIGFDEKRGDKVTVVNSSFSNPTTDIVMAPIQFWNQPWFWDYLKKVIGISLGFIFLFILYKRLGAYMKTSVQSQRNVDLVARLKEDEDLKTMDNEVHQLKQEKLNKLKELASSDPQRVALIIKNWVGK